MDNDALPFEPWNSLENQKALTNTLSMSLYDVSDVSEKSNNRDSIRRLARTAKDINEYFGSLDYPWLSSLAPQFGIHKDHDGVLCLRGVCRYGSSVADEWRSVVALLEFTKQSPSSDTNSLVAECWDEDDGPLLLIQASDNLPLALSEGSHTGGRYRSWIKTGQIHFLLDTPDKELDLSEALDLIRQQGLALASPAIQKEIRSTSLGTDAQQWQKTVIIVREENAGPLTQESGIVHAAIQHVAFERNVSNSQRTTSSGQGNQHVWLPIRIGRTSYAMLRSMIPDDSFVYFAMGEMIERGMSSVRRSNVDPAVNRMAAWREEILGNDMLEIADDDALHSCPVFDLELRDRQFNCSHTVGQIPGLRAYDGSRSPSEAEAFDIDSESWLFLSDNNTNEANGLNSVHKGLNSFFTGDCSPDGVHGKLINYGKMLRILHSALQTSSADEFQYKLNAEFDPFFTREDYDLVSDTKEESIEKAMQSMDNELNRDKDGGSAIEVMSNLLQSLEMGGPGPTRHLLNEMNQTAPNVTEQDFST